MDFPFANAFNLTASLAGLAIVMLAWTASSQSDKFGTPRAFPLGRFIVSVVTIGIGSASMMPGEYCFLAVALGILGGLTICKPAVGVATMLFFWITRPWELGVDISLLSKLPRLWIVLIGIGLIYEKGVAKDFWIRMRGHLWLWLIFISWLSFTAVFATDKAAATQLIITQLIPIAVFLVLFAQVAKDYQVVLIGLAASCISVGLVAFVQALLTTDLEVVISQRFKGLGMWSNSNDVAAVLIIGVPIILSAKGLKSPIAIFSKYATAGTLIFLVLLTQSRAALLSLLFGFAVSIIKFRLTTTRLIVIISFGVACLLASSLFTRSESDMEGSSTARFNYAITGFKMLMHSPIWGIGISNYPIRFEEFTSDFSEYGQRTAHSSWVLVMAEAGLIGLFLFFRMYYLAIRDAWKARTTHPELIASLASYTVMMSTLSHTYLILPYVLFAITSFAASEVDGTLEIDSKGPTNFASKSAVNLK